MKTINKIDYLGKGWTPALSVKTAKDGVWFIQYLPITHIMHLSNESRIEFKTRFNKALDLGYKVIPYIMGKFGNCYFLEKDNQLLTKEEFNNL